MNDWHTCRNGNPRQPWDLERLARHRAAKLGYRAHRSRRRKGPQNAGGVMLIHKASSTVFIWRRIHRSRGDDPRVHGTGADAIAAVFSKATDGQLTSQGASLGHAYTGRKNRENRGRLRPG